MSGARSHPLPALTRAESLIRSIPDYPEPGIIFRDITPLLADAEALRVTTEAIIEPFAGRFDVVPASRLAASSSPGRPPSPQASD